MKLLIGALVLMTTQSGISFASESACGNKGVSEKPLSIGVSLEGSSDLKEAQKDKKNPLSFPCDLKSFGSLPEIVVHPADHGTREWAELESKLIKEAQKGQIFFAHSAFSPEETEVLNGYLKGAHGILKQSGGIAGYKYDGLANMVIGLQKYFGLYNQLREEEDDEESRLLAQLGFVDSAATKSRDELNLAREKHGFFENVLGNPGIKSVWKDLRATELKSENLKPEQERFASALDRLTSLPLPVVNQQLQAIRLGQGEFGFLWKQNDTFLEFSRRLAVQLGKNAKAKNPSLDMNLYNRVLGDPTDTEQFVEAANQYGVKDSLPFLVSNLASFYCQAAKSGRPLHILVSLSVWENGIIESLQDLDNGLGVKIRDGVSTTVSRARLAKTKETLEKPQLKLMENKNFKAGESSSSSTPTASSATAGADSKAGSEEVSRICGSCGKSPANLKCSKCKRVRYCSKDCQRKDWGTHKTKCKP